MERLLVFYYYKQPPSFDSKMTVNALSMMVWAPIVYLLMTYWFLSNNQIFDNILYPMQYVNDVIKTGHTIVSDIRDLNYD